MANLKKLLSLLDELIALFKIYELNRRAEQLADIKTGISNNWPASFRELKAQVGGGMGSLADIFICPENNDKILPNDVKKVNKKLNKLLDNIYKLLLKIS